MSEPTTRRRSTVHDFSNLRLHPDGSRVPINSPSRDTFNDSRSRNTGRDIRGNRVARDAAGLGVVPKRGLKSEDDTDDVQNTKPRVPRHGKRRRIDDHIEFLGNFGCGVHRAGGDTTDADREAMRWPAPSSVRSGRPISPLFHATHLPFVSSFRVMQDLLKCVHHFASRYYAARGLLSDRSRKYRREVRQRKTGHALAAAGGTGEKAGADAVGDDVFTEDGDGEDRGDYSGKDDPCKGGLSKENRRWSEGKGAPSERVPDMYRALDGSALMAIGTSILADCIAWS